MRNYRPLNELPRHACLVLICLGAVSLGGCATAGDIHFTGARPQTPLKLLLVQSPAHITTARLQKVLAPQSKTKLDDTAPPIVRGIRHFRQRAAHAMETALSRQTGLRNAKPPTSATRLLTEFKDADYQTVPPQTTATQLQTLTGADAILKFRITDYGLTPTTWRSGYITFEVVSTLAIAGVIASAGSTVAKGAAGAYLTQEAVEETAEGYAGFWAVDVVYRPVRIEAELIQLHPVRIVWSSSDTGLSDYRFSRLTHKVSQTERDRQLEAATDAAASDVVTELVDALHNHRQYLKRTPAERKSSNSIVLFQNSK